MANKSKIYSWWYENRPSIDETTIIIPFSSLTEADATQTIKGKINTVTVQMQMRRAGTSTVSVESMFTLDNGTTTYSSDEWVSCNDITETSTKWYTLTMSASKCPPTSFFNAKNFTLKVKYQNATRTGIYCLANSRFILTVNYSPSRVFVYDNGWKEATPYIYTSNGWKLAESRVYDNSWK